MADIGDKVTRVIDKAMATLEAPGKSPGDSSIRISRAFTVDTAVIFFMREVNVSTGETIPNSVTVWKGVPVDNTLTELQLLHGEDRRYEPGQSTQVYIPISSYWANSLIDAFLYLHDNTGKLKDKTVALTNINGGTTAGILKTDASGAVSAVSKLSAENIDLTSLGFAAVQCDGSNYRNSNINKARLKNVISQGGGITVDTDNNEFIIGAGVKRAKVTATIMADSLSTYLYLLVRHKKQGQSNYRDITQALTPRDGQYGGTTVVGVIDKLTEGDRIAVFHDCSGTIRGQYSQVIVEQV